ncbi:MAG: exodeoxyribonuclease VII small subunit [Gammaproteobacteria bacterium]|nr:exodeoxyribonuclease VII small subunit [Gammaproteobacteria bacterium]
MPKGRAKPGFEAALREFEQLVERMESGELPLEESLKLYARGMELSRTCREALDDAERRVEVLSGQGTIQALDIPTDDHDSD